MKVLLIQPPIRDFYRTRFREYPLGLLYIAGSLEKHSIKSQILDARKISHAKTCEIPKNLDYLRNLYTKENDLFVGYKHFGFSYEKIQKRVCESEPDIVILSSMFTPYVNEVIETAKAIKIAKPNITVIAGGHHATNDPDSLLRGGHIDHVIRGEGENSLAEFLSTPSLHQVAKNHLIENLDSIPFPARHLIDPDAYTFQKKRYTMILTSRGCPHRCTFCSVHSVCGHKHRTRSIDNVIAEIEECVERFGIEVFDFQDDNLLFDKDRIKILLEKIIAKFGDRIEVMASNGLNVSHLDSKLLSLMKRAGFKKLDLAIATGKVVSRENLKRPESVEYYEDVLETANSLKLPVTTYIILGIPTQPLSEMIETVDYLKSKKTLISPSIFYNVPGMDIFEEMKRFEYTDDHIARRSSAFNNFGLDFTRDDIFKIFLDIRRFNLSTTQKTC
ncbi:MAG: radical SAM protein [Pseudomonadota bacterium]